MGPLVSVGKRHEYTFTFSLCSAVKTQISRSETLDHCMNCCFHCITDTDDVQSTRQLFLMVHAAVIPTKVLPAPQGSTMIPDRARLWVTSEELQRDGGCATKASLPVPEHLAQTLLLIRSDDSGWLQVYVEICVDSIVVKVVFFKHRVIQLSTSPLDLLQYE